MIQWAEVDFYGAGEPFAAEAPVPPPATLAALFRGSPSRERLLGISWERDDIRQAGSMWFSDAPCVQEPTMLVTFYLGPRSGGGQCYRKGDAGRGLMGPGARFATEFAGYGGSLGLTDWDRKLLKGMKVGG